MQNLAPILIALAFVIGAVYLFRTATRRGPEDGRPAAEKIPAALRPGDTDDVLESDRIGSIIRWGSVLTAGLAVFLPIYWLQEAGERRATEAEFLQQSIDRGRYYYATREDPETGNPPPRGTAHPAGEPFECARCHGSNLEGGQNTYVDPETGERVTVQVPELLRVFARYETPPPGFPNAREYITTVIERGRTNGVLGVGYDMPTWGSEFGGPLTPQLITDIVNYLESIQEVGPPEDEGPPDGEQIFAQFCASCHGAQGTGGVGPPMTGGAEAAQFPNVEDHIAFVNTGSRPGQPYGTNGQGTGGMPGWEGSLSEEEIRAVVEYERSL